MRPSAFFLTLALFFAAPLAALADLHVNIIQTHSNPYAYYNAAVTVRNSCHATMPVVCWGDGTIYVHQDDHRYHHSYEVLQCDLSVWRSGGGPFSSATWHADMPASGNPKDICKWHWVNNNTIDLTIKN